MSPHPFPAPSVGPLAAAGVAGVPLALQGRGTVYGVLLNHPGALAALGEAVHQPPYKAPPIAPVLYLKPRNTWVGDAARVALPRGVDAVEVGATLGLVIGRTAHRVTEAQALDHLAGCVVVNDLNLPHESYYRPALRQRCRDGFCPIGPALVPRSALGDLDDLAIEVAIDGVVVHRSRTAGLLRPVARLVADISAFSTLHPGDLLLTGVAPGAPLAHAGQRVQVRIAGVGTLQTWIVADDTETHASADNQAQAPEGPR
jgi:5-oxopent-3-ene-1,2,5-tricarboxylate decarboxylase / 2-hydroxyhepta-2,4-diene-1,7-dioate isomerase